MNKQINISALRNSLLKYKATSNSTSGLSKGVKYLYENFYLPLLHEKPVTFGQLDYTRFDSSDIVEICEIYDSCQKNIGLLGCICTILEKTDGVAKQSAFI